MRSRQTRAIQNGWILAWCTAVAMLLLGLVAVTIPADVITQYRFLRGYIAVSSTIIPGIERLAAVSSFPEVTRLVVSMMWTLVPIFTAVYLLKMRVPEENFEQFRQRPFVLTFSIIIVASLIVLFAVLREMTFDDLARGTISEIILRGVSTSRVSLGLIAGFLSAAIAAMLYIVLIWFLNLRRIYFPEQGGNKL